MTGNSTAHCLEGWWKAFLYFIYVLFAVHGSPSWFRKGDSIISHVTFACVLLKFFSSLISNSEKFSQILKILKPSEAELGRFLFTMPQTNRMEL